MAVGGIVRVLNGSRVVNNQIEEVRLPKSPIEVMQVIEYLRAFLVGREAWAGFNMLPIISGAFGVFQRDLVMQVGGFRTGAVGEDLDLVIRMHRRLHEEGRQEIAHDDRFPNPCRIARNRMTIDCSTSVSTRGTEVSRCIAKPPVCNAAKNSPAAIAPIGSPPASSAAIKPDQV